MTNDFTRCPGCRLIRPEGEGLCPSCAGIAEYERDRIEAEADIARLKADPFLKNPEPEPFRPAAPYRPDQVRGEAPAQSCLEMPDAGPLFAGCLEAKS